MDEFDWIKDVKMDTHLDYPETWTNKKLSRKDARKVKHLTYKYSYSFWDGGLQKKRETLEHRMRNYDDSIMNGSARELYELFVIADKYDITMEDLNILWSTNVERQRENRRDYRKRPKRVRKDNQKTINYGSGYGNRNSIRYPSKKRSRRTWKNFYTLFPHLAERDGWDGKTSKRMK